MGGCELCSRSSIANLTCRVWLQFRIRSSWWLLLMCFLIGIPGGFGIVVLTSTGKGVAKVLNAMFAAVAQVHEVTEQIAHGITRIAAGEAHELLQSTQRPVGTVVIHA